jgi:predicted NBD/HSP70 family sugar kinase
MTRGERDKVDAGTGSGHVPSGPALTRNGTNLGRVGGYNRAVILDAIRRQDGVSRVELAEQTGLTNQTVSNIVRRLLDDGLVTESGRTPSRGGKPRTALRVRSDACYSVGLHLDPTMSVTVLVDLAGRIVARRRRPRRAPGSDPARLVRGLVPGVTALVADAGVDRSRVIGLGVAVPGPLDTSHGLVVEPPNFLNWHQVALRDALAEGTGLPVVLDNDATAAAIGERWAGGAAREGSFLFIYLGAGIGGGIVHADQVLRGDTGNAGEFGHITVVPDGIPCRCGARGCLEAYCTPAALVAELVHRHGRRAATRIGLTLRPETIRNDCVRLCRAARDGDPAAADVLDRGADRIAQAALTAVNLLDLGRIVLGVDALGPAADMLRDAIDRRVNSQAIARRIRTVAVEPSLLGADAGAVGAASLVLHGRYSPGWSQLRA